MHILQHAVSGGLQGGMMEEWHQKLHNNSSPDDIIICQALLAYLQSDLDISKYWAVLLVRPACPCLYVQLPWHM